VPIEHVVLVEEREVRLRKIGDEKIGLGRGEGIALVARAGRILLSQLACAPDDKIDAAVVQGHRGRLDVMQRPGGAGAVRQPVDQRPDFFR
jgi:hypothetical protein